MQEEALEEVNLKIKPRATRMLRNKAARMRRQENKLISETRLINEYNRMRRIRKRNS